MPALIEALFPAEPRRLPGRRWMNIVMRCAHLVGVAGCGAGFFFDIDPARWSGFWHLTVLSGLALTALYLVASGRWLLQLQGAAIVAKLALMAVGAAVPSLRAPLFVATVVISGLIAHAPSAVRHWSPLPWSGGGADGPRRCA